MNYIFVNLKRFDIQPVHGGVNRLAPMGSWGAHIARSLQAGLTERASRHENSAFAAFFPEAHILAAVEALADVGGRSRSLGPLGIGCQSVHHADTAAGGNFGAFTSLRTANAARELGCGWTIIGHSEERRYKAELMAMAGAEPRGIAAAVDRLLNMQVACALKAGLKVLFCIGETAEEVPERSAVLERQIGAGLAGIAPPGGEVPEIVLAYEPVWAIGPGKTPPTAAQIEAIADGIKAMAPYPLVYGGGLKKENALSIGGIAALDGGLVALTRFSGDIGFYPDEFLDIVDAYFAGCVTATAGGRSP